jgi:hypothetical protein
MRTTLELEDRLMEALLARHPGASKREVVERAIRAYLALDAVDRIRSLAGHLEIDDVTAESRRDRVV